MVFSGKPSTGCQMCRSRRIKCDEAKPSCSQCVRTGRTCPGYKSQIDLLFRNETGASAAEKRARNASRKKSLAAPTAASGSASGSASTAATAAAAAEGSSSSQHGSAAYSKDAISPASSSSHSQLPALSPVSAPATSAQATSKAAAQAASFSSFSLSDPILPQSAPPPAAQRPSSIPVASARKTGQARKQSTAASRKNAATAGNAHAGGKTYNRKAIVAGTAAPTAPTAPPAHPASATNVSAISNRNTFENVDFNNFTNTDSNVRIEALNPPGSYDDHFMIDTYAKASMSYVLAHRQSPDYEYRDLSLASLDGTPGFVEEEEEDDDPSSGNSNSSSLSSSAQTIRRQHRHSDFGGTAEVINPAITPPPSDLAIHHFFSNFIMIPYGSSTRGYLDFLMPLMKQVNSPVATHLASLSTSPSRHSQDALIPTSEAALALSYAFRACALASMGTRVASNYYPFMDKAVSAYTRALAATTRALRDPDLRCSDTTLAAVLLLGIFESITAKQLGLFAWGSHIEGAIEIVKARSLEQRTTRTGRSLFIAVRTQMIIHSLATGKLPGMAHEWWFENAVSDSIAAHCQRLSIRAAELRSETTACMERVSYCMAQKPPHIMAEVRALADKAYALDHECVVWMHNLPAEWNYRTVAWQDDLPEGTDYSKANVFPGYVDEYPDLYIVGCWNMMRGTRLCISSIGVRCAAWACWPADYRTTPEYRAAETISKDMIQRIVSSVPFYMGCATKDGMFRHSRPDDGWTWLDKHKFSAAHVYSGSSSGSDTPSPEAYPPTPPREPAATPSWSSVPPWQVDPAVQSHAGSGQGQTGPNGPNGSEGLGGQPYSTETADASGTAHPIQTTITMPPTTHPYSSYMTSTCFHEPSSGPAPATPPPAAAAGSPESATTTPAPASTWSSAPASTSGSTSTAFGPNPLQSEFKHQRGYHYDHYTGPGHTEYVSVSPAQAGFMLGNDSELKGLSGYFLAWPLTNIASQDYTTDKQREWIIGRLEYISDVMGVRYAGFLSGVKFRAPSMMIRRDRSVAQQALLAATGQMGKGESVSSPFVDMLGIKKSDATSP